MSLKSLLKRIGRALPVILANAPAVIDAVKSVAKAVKKPATAAAGPPPSEAPGAAAAP